MHPINSAHDVDREHPDDRLVLEENYFDRRRYSDFIERDDVKMTFESRHYTLQDYFEALLGAGFQVKALREVGDPQHPRWSRYPLFLHVLATRRLRRDLQGNLGFVDPRSVLGRKLEDDELPGPAPVALNGTSRIEGPSGSRSGRRRHEALAENAALASTTSTLNVASKVLAVPVMRSGWKHLRRGLATRRGSPA